MVTVDGFKFPDDAQPRLTGMNEDISSAGGIQSGSAYIYPEGSRLATDAWFLPVILVGESIVWRGLPERKASDAKRIAHEHLRMTMQSMLSWDSGLQEPSA